MLREIDHEGRVGQDTRSSDHDAGDPTGADVGDFLGFNRMNAPQLDIRHLKLHCIAEIGRAHV